MSTWPDKSGSMRYRPEPLTIDNQQLQLSIVNSYNAILKLDHIIEQYAYALEIIQPSVTGKIAVRFLKRPWGGTEGRHPQIIQWYKTRNDRFLYHRYKTNEVLNKVKKYPVFAPVEEDVKTILREVISQIEHREALLAAINNFKRQMASMFTRNESYMEEKQAQITEWLPKLNEKREQLILEWKESVAAAEQALPTDAVPHPSTRPRSDMTGRTRGEIHSTHKSR